MLPDIKSLYVFTLILSFTHLFALSFSDIRNKRARNLLCSLLLFIILFCTESYLVLTGKISDYPFLIRVSFPFYYFLGIIPYLVVKSITIPHFKFERKNLKHLIIPIINFIIFLPFYSKGASEKILYLTNTEISSERRLFFILQFLIILAYTISALKRLQEYRTFLKHAYSALEHVRMEAMKRTLIFLVIVEVVLVILFLFPSPDLSANSFHIARLTFYLSGIFMATLFMLMSIDPLIELIKVKKVYQLHVDKTSNSDSEISLPSEEKEEIKNKIINGLEVNKLYLDENLKLSDFSEAIQVPSYLVSHIINRELDKTFNELINDYRIEEAKRLLKKDESKNLTILAIAQDSGFKSKSVFNALFKKKNGITPSQFREK